LDVAIYYFALVFIQNGGFKEVIQLLTQQPMQRLLQFPHSILSFLLHQQLVLAELVRIVITLHYHAHNMVLIGSGLVGEVGFQAK